MSAQKPTAAKQKKEERFDNPKDFKPNAYREVIGTSTSKVAGEKTKFTVSHEPTLRIAMATASASSGVIDTKFNGIYAPDAVEESTGRVGLFGLAKKLVFSAPEDIRSDMHLKFAPLKYAIVKLAEPMKEVIEGIGAMEFNGTDCEVRSVEMVIFSAFARATGVPGQQGIPPLANLPGQEFSWNLSFVNRAWAGWKTMVYEEYRDRYNAWTESGTAVRLQMGGMTIHPPRLEAGFVQLRQVIANAGAPQQVVNDVTIAALFEANQGNAAWPDQQGLAQLTVLGLIVLNWDKPTMQDRIAWWKKNHQDYVTNVYSHIYNIHEVVSFEATGSLWQLMNVDGNVGTHPFSLPQKDIEMGMITSNQTVITVNKQALTTTTHLTKLARAEVFVNSKVKYG